MRVIIYPYKMGSGSAKSLKAEFKSRGYRCKRVYQDGNYIPRATDFVINWGNSKYPQWVEESLVSFDGKWLNGLSPVEKACNKLLTFQLLKEAGVSIPEFTTDRNVAEQWYGNGIPLVERHTLTGSSGDGVRYVEGEEIMTSCPLYVKYIKKSAEYRVHVVNGEVIDYAQKKKRKNFEGEVDTKIRSHSRGWVFCRENVVVPPSVLSEAIKGVKALGLDFGAVDVIWNGHYQKAYVLEVNTAPGLEGTTIKKYVDAFVKLIGE